MERMTQRRPEDAVAFVPAGALAPEAEGFTGEAIERLACFEDFYASVAEDQEAITRQLEDLRSRGKEKTVQFNELLTRKLMNTNMAIRLRSFGLE